MKLYFRMWIFVALLGNVVLAIVGIMEKFILTKSVVKPIVLLFYSTIFILPFFLLLPFGIQMPNVWTDYFVFALSGFCFALGLWSMYIAIGKSEISRVGPLIGAAAPFFILFLSRIFLAEKLTPYALAAAAVLMLGSLVISFEKSARHSAWHRGLEWAILAGFLFAISHVTAKYAYTAYGFYSGFVWSKLSLGLFGVGLLLSPSVRALFRKKSKTGADKLAGKNRFVLVAGDIALGVVGTVLLQYAMALGSVSLVNALAGAQYAMLIVFVAIISKFRPKILKEKYTRKEIIRKVVAVAIISFGLVLLLVNPAGFKSQKNMIYGVSFNTEYAYYLGLDPKKVFDKILADWNFKYIRLSAQWNLIEKTKGQYDWTDLDWLMNSAAARNAKVVLAIGNKTPRWPECHFPDWVDASSYGAHKQDLLDFMKTAVERYKNHPALEVWQVENEPFLDFGACRPLSDRELKDEVALVKQLDPAHPIMVTDSGELSTWRRTARQADLFGTTAYRIVWDKWFGYWSYDWIMPAFVYRAKLWLNGRDLNSAYISELQAEPWIPNKPFSDSPLAEQFKSMSLEQLKKNIIFASETGMPRAYLWGAEWWYWLESKGERGIPDFIKELKK